MRTPPLPASFISYISASAALSIASKFSCACSNQATPRLAATGGKGAKAAATAAAILRLASAAASALVSGKMMANSSPPSLATVSVARRDFVNAVSHRL